MARKLGIFGGSFDPVHYGHLLLAERCREEARLDEVLFIPAAIAPHKRDRELSSGEDRLTMLQLAVGGQESFRVSRLEIDRSGVSYTVDTLGQLRNEYPDAELFLLMGTDTLVDLPNWREPSRVLALARPLVVGRSGEREPNWECLLPLVTQERLAELRQGWVQMPRIELSSSEIRRRIAAGQSIRYQTPRAVEQYIRTRELYRV